MTKTDSTTYAVDIEAGEASVKLIQDHVKSTYNENVLSSGETSFGGCLAFDPLEYKQPVLVSGTDGVGTKSEIAFELGKYDTIGIDLVAANVDDIAAQGAKPLFFLDYVAVGIMDPDVMEQIVRGVTQGCLLAEVPLIGGEMSDHRGLIEPGHFDLSGTAVGVVERSKIRPQNVSDGDVIIGIDSPNIRANGFTLVRDIFVGKNAKAPRDLNSPAFKGADISLGDALIEPSVIYSSTMQKIYLDEQAGDILEGVHACAHITGGGIVNNVSRILPSNLDAQITRGTWEIPEIFNEIAREGNVAPSEMEKVFNLGIGYAIVANESSVAKIEEIIATSGRKSYRIGKIASGTGKVHLSDK